MRIITWCKSRIFLNILYNEYRTYLRWGSSFIDVKPNFPRHFNVSGFLLKNDFDKFQKPKTSSTNVQSIKGKKSSKITKEDDSEGKILAEENNPEFSEPEDNKTKPILDESDGKKKFIKEKKEKQLELKIFKLRSVIDNFNLQIKIKNMLKYVEKGRKVFVEIRGEDFDNILNEFRNSKLNDFYLATDKSTNKVCLTYGKKPEKKSNTAVNVEAEKSVETVKS